MYQNVAGFSSTLTHVSISVSLSLDSSALSQALTPPVHTPCPTWQTARRPHCLLHWARQGPQRLKPHQMACLLGGWMICCLLTAQRGGMWMESSCSACCEKNACSCGRRLSASSSSCSRRLSASSFFAIENIPKTCQKTERMKPKQKLEHVSK